MSFESPGKQLSPFQESRLISTLLKSPLLRDVSLTVLRDLLRAAAHHTFKRGEIIHAADAGCLKQGLLVLSGEVRVTGNPGYFVGAGSSRGRSGGPQVAILTEGDSFGESCLLADEPWEGEIVVERSAKVLLLSEGSFTLLLEHSPSLRRAVGQRPEALVMAVVAPHRFVGLPLSALTELLAVSIDRCFPENVLVLRVVDRGADPMPFLEPERFSDAQNVHLVELAVGGPERVQAAVERYAEAFDYIFIDASACALPLREAIEGAHHQLLLTYDPQEAEAILPAASQGEIEVMYTLLLTADGGVHPQGQSAHEAQDVAGFVVFEGRAGSKSQRASAHSLGRGGAARSGIDGVRGDSAGDPLKESCRVRLDLADIQRRWAPEAGRAQARAAVYKTYQKELDRWARFVTQRTVGMALGGGGAWGYIHVALIQGLRAAGVPVDMVSGTSFGSLVGAYYCTLGSPGLDLLVKRGPWLQAVSLVSLFTTQGLQRLVDKDLSAARLETIRVPFYPVTTNLTTTQGVALSRGPVSLGVRASSSAPLVFAPTVIAGIGPAAGRFVDGVVVNNVPVNALLKKGADLVVGSNVYPAPSGRPAIYTSTFDRLRALSFGRIEDASTSLNLALHAAGDWQAAMANVTYDATESVLGMTSSLGAARFALSEAILDAARADPMLAEVVEDVSSRWVRLRDKRPV